MCPLSLSNNADTTLCNHIAIQVLTSKSTADGNGFSGTLMQLQPNLHHNRSVRRGITEYVERETKKLRETQNLLRYRTPNVY